METRTQYQCVDCKIPARQVVTYQGNTAGTKLTQCPNCFRYVNTLAVPGWGFEQVIKA